LPGGALAWVGGEGKSFWYKVRKQIQNEGAAKEGVSDQTSNRGCPSMGRQRKTSGGAQLRGSTKGHIQGGWMQILDDGAVVDKININQV